LTQNQLILHMMQENHGITTYTAFKNGITRLAARIKELRDSGYSISSEIVRYTADDGKKKSYCIYRLESKK